MFGNTIPSSSIVLAWFWPCDGLADVSLPSSSMISQGLAGSFQPSQAFNDFQKHGDRSHGSHDEARSQFLGGRRQSTAHPRVRSEPHISRQARCPPWD